MGSQVRAPFMSLSLSFSLCLLYSFPKLNRHFPLFFETFHIPTRSWKIYKAKFIDLLLKNNTRNSTKFVIGFSGSSVTAGHDNYFTEAYPAIVEQTLQKIFTPLGIELEVFPLLFPVENSSR